MASTYTNVHSQPSVAVHQFTSASTAVDEIISFGFKPQCVMYVQGVTATNPSIYWGSLNAAGTPADTVKQNGADGVITSPAHTAGVSIGYSLTASDANGAVEGQVAIDATVQTNDGVNLVIAFR